MDGNLVLEIKSQAESELRSAVGSLKPEEAAVLAMLRDSTGERSRATWQLQLCNEEAVPRERSCKRHSSLNCPTEIDTRRYPTILILAAPNGGLLLPAFIAQKVTNKVTC